MTKETQIPLRTREDILSAREQVYGQLANKSGELSPDRAAVMEKLLRGQEETAIGNPMKFLALISGNKRFEVHAADVADRIGQFVNPKALRA